ncbi:MULTISPECIES: SpoIIE family protein phosphatase [Streptomyces]|uniref:SpoIIE family protein phosphatase n=1 Tax=Streptomyces TaxID=1883 RepID=UPI001CCF6031|nr:MULTISPECIES: SpoIIE family protein phosphatase [Streptomyces]UBI35748.1 SpoIIE family protein phosphatase [Streptomyces mobaraensis]UKW28341.1 SpoIIE family protein phosphatase [Streptomyces sp. TYQ1024]
MPESPESTAPPPPAPDWRMFDPAPVAMAVTRGPRHRLVYMNAVYRELFGDRPLGVPITEVFADLRQRGYLALFDDVRNTGAPVSLAAAPTEGASPEDGGTRYYTFSLSAVGASEEERGVLVVAMDVTEQIRATERIRRVSEERLRALRRFENLVTANTQMMWVTAAKGGTIEPSPGWERVTGQTWEQFRGDGWLDALHPEDREPMDAAWQRALEEVPDEFRYVYRLRTVDGTYRHFDVRAVPVREGDRVVEWVGTCTDIEDRWREERRKDVLARGAAVLAESTKPRSAFAALGDVIVPSLADKCGIYLMREPTYQLTGDTPLVVERIAARSREGLPPHPARLGEEHIAPDSAFARAVRERRVVHESFDPDRIPPGTAPPDSMAWLRDVRAHSMVVVPVVIDGTLAAIVDAFACGERDPIDATDEALLRELLEQAHDPLRNVIEFQRTQRVALALQHSLLTEPPRYDDLVITARYLPSPAAADVGGDWYDSFVLGDGAPVLVIGDVAGHDIEAAVTMSRMRNMLRSLAADREEPPGDIIRRLDRATQVLDPEEGTATCALVRIEHTPDGGRQAHYCVAGHPPPLVVDRDGGTRFLEGATSPLLGMPVPDEWRISGFEPLPPGGTLLLYTDGLVERPDEDIDEGLARLARTASGLAGADLNAFCDTLLAEPSVTGQDDICLIAVRLPE